MCTIVVHIRQCEAFPVLLAANRDEFLSRESLPPRRLHSVFPIYGGQDVEGGGTWLAVTPSGFFAGVTNQRMRTSPDPDRKSRGQLVLQLMEVLCGQGTQEACQWVKHLHPAQFNPFHLVFGHRGQVWYTPGVDAIMLQELSVGLHVITNDGLNATTFPKVEAIRKRLGALHSPQDWLRVAEELLGDTTVPPLPADLDLFGLPLEMIRALHAPCVDLPHYGTVSSTLLAIPDEGEPEYWFADGSPNRVSFENVSNLLQDGKTVA